MEKSLVPCDICLSMDAIEVPASWSYTNGEPIHICNQCGFVHAKLRRSADEIAKSWAKDLFGDKFDEKTYSPAVPAVRARQTFVADFLDQVKVSGFQVVREKRVIGSDKLCLIGEKSALRTEPDLRKDDPNLVYSFFERWHTETEMHYR